MEYTYTSIVIKKVGLSQWWILGIINKDLYDCLRFFESEEEARAYAEKYASEREIPVHEW